MHTDRKLVNKVIAHLVPGTASSDGHHRASYWKRGISYLPGLALTASIAFASVSLSRIVWLQTHGISALTIAIILGMLLGNTLYAHLGTTCVAGVGFSKQVLLRMGIILYGLHLTFQDIEYVGWPGLMTDTVIVCSTFGLSWILGTRLLGLERNTAWLIGVGSAFCGAAAVMATEPVVRGRAEQVTIAVSTVVVFGTLGLFLYPVIYQWNEIHQLLPMTSSAYGIYVGSSIHEVAQVVGAANAVSEQATTMAIITKMVRVMMLAPFLIILSVWLIRSEAVESATSVHSESNRRSRITIPWFALGFIAAAGLNSLHILPHNILSTVIDIDTLMLTMAMAGLGLATHASALRNAGIKPLILASLLFAWLVVGGALVNHLVHILLK